MKAICPLILVLFLSGCATLNRDQCERGDWFGIGVADGQEGAPLNRIDQHQRACAEYGVIVDNQHYMEGRTQGLVEYCRLGNAFESGLRGQQYQGVCPPAIDPLFERYNAAAFEVFRIRKEIDSLDSQLSSREYQLMGKDLTEEGRVRMRQDIRDLDIERDRMRMDLHASERLLDRLMDEAAGAGKP